MGYINDKFREDEVREYDIPNYGKEKFYVGTIDREKDIRLHEYRNGPVDEPSDEFDFIFDYKGHVIFVCLVQSIIANTVDWYLKSLEIPSNAAIHRDEVIKELRAAVKTHGCMGYKQKLVLGDTNISVKVWF